MSRKKKQTKESNPMVVDEAEFTDVIRKMVNTSPVTREEVEKNEKRRRGIQRRKNPETDPRYLPVFDFSRPIKLAPGEEANVQRTYEDGMRYRAEQQKRKKR
jgi:hypothetical protein